MGSLTPVPSSVISDARAVKRAEGGTTWRRNRSVSNSKCYFVFCTQCSFIFGIHSNCIFTQYEFEILNNASFIV